MWNDATAGSNYTVKNVKVITKNNIFGTFYTNVDKAFPQIARKLGDKLHVFGGRDWGKWLKMVSVNEKGVIQDVKYLDGTSIGWDMDKLTLAMWNDATAGSNYTVKNIKVIT
jgi:hypothetical protein